MVYFTDPEARMPVLPLLLQKSHIIIKKPHLKIRLFEGGEQTLSQEAKNYFFELSLYFVAFLYFYEPGKPAR